MKDDCAQGRVRFATKEVLDESARAVLAHWKTYLSWGIVPLFLWMLYGYASTALIRPDKANWTGAIACLAVAPVVWLVQVVFSLRVYRLVIGGLWPDGNALREMVARRTWRYVKAWIVVGLKVLFVGLALGLLLGAAGWFFLTGAEFLAARPAATERFWGLVGTVIQCVAVLILVEQVVLVFPDVAMDGKGSLWRLNRRAGYARWPIAKIVILVRGGPILLALYPAVADLFQWRTTWADDSGMAVGVYVLSLAASFFSIFTDAVLYKRLSPSWPALDALDGGEPKPGRVPIEREVAKAASAAPESPGRAGQAGA